MLVGDAHLARRPVDGDGRGAGDVFGRGVEALRDAEIEHLHDAAIGHEDVRRLQVAVDDAVRVRALEGPRHRHEELDERARRELLLAQLRHRLALEVLEHHERQALVLADLVDRDDVLERAARRRARLDHEAADDVRIVLEQELEGDLAAELGVAREEDLAHAAACDLADQPEAADLLVAADLERLARARRGLRTRRGLRLRARASRLHALSV